MREFLNQIRTLWSRLETPQRASIALILVVFVVFIGGVFWSAAQPDYRALIQNADRATVVEIAAMLEDENVQYRITDNEHSILVPSKDYYRLRNTLSQNDMLSEAGTGFELLDETGFADSTFKEQKNYDRAIAGELERSFLELPGVKGARVIVVRPEPSPFLQDDRQSTASVFLDMKSGRNLNDKQVMGIVRLTASSVEGLASQRVEVVDSTGPLTRWDRDEGVSMASTALEAATAREQHLTRKGQAMLDKVLGPGRGVVTVAVDLDFTERQRQTVQVDRENSTVLSERTRTTDETTPIFPPGGVAGTQPNVEGQPVAGAPQSEPATTNTEENQREYAVGEVKTTTKEELGRIRGMNVSILLDHKVEVVAKQDENGDPVVDENGQPVMEEQHQAYSDAERERFKEMVLNAIGFYAYKGTAPAAADEVPIEERFQASVTSMKVYSPDTGEITQEAGLIPDADLLQQVGKYAVAVVVALGLLMVARGQLKRSQQAWESEKRKRDEAEAEARQKQEAQESSPEAVMAKRLELKDAVRKQILDAPDSAAKVLRSWIYE